MRILFVTQCFPPEMGALAARVHELSRAWVRMGHDVTVVTAFAHHPIGIKKPEDRWRLTRKDGVDGIGVIRVWDWAVPNEGALKRMISFVTFMFSATVIGGLRADRPDVVIASSPQLLSGVAGYALARMFRRPFVFEVRDLWPEGIVAVSLMRENWVIAGLRRVARFLYENADCLVTVGAGYRQLIHEGYGIPVESVKLIPNGIDTALFKPMEAKGGIRSEYGWGDRFVVMYVGTHGMAHGLEKVLEAARELRGESDILFVLVGEGPEKAELKRKAAEWGLKNVQFIDQQAKARIPEFYAACDLGLVNLTDVPLHEGSIPSKIFEYMGMAKPILLAVRGHARRIVEDARCGEYVPPGDVGAMVEAVRRLSKAGVRLAEMGESGRSYVLARHDRDQLAREYLGLLSEVVAGQARTSR